MIKKTLFVAVLLYTVVASAFAQGNVSNIRIEQQDSLLHVFYDLDVKSNISIYFSKDNGQTFMGPLTGVVGDVGRAVEPGKDRLIIWDVVREMGYIDINSAKVKIVAEAIVKPVVATQVKRTFEWRNLIMVGSSWSPSTPISYSIMYGRYKKFGYYVKFESNFNFPKTTTETHHSYDHIFWDGTGSHLRIAGYVGGIWNFSKHVMLNLGLGYSYGETYANTIGGQKLKFDRYSNDLNIELGVIGNFGKFSLGINALCLPTRDGHYGIDVEDLFGGSISVGVNF
ncbi:MAG: hypothetical protein RSE22_07875 [Mucinivorans sp.]